MPIAINGTGTITGISVGGLPDAIITGAELDGAQTGSAPIYGARAWVCFNGTGTPSVRASGNISSITDNGTGDYTANFTTAMPDINYSAAGNTAGTPNADGCSVTGLGGATNYRSTSSLRFLVFYNPGNTTTDRDYINLQIFR
jgi:hypothetical protein